MKFIKYLLIVIFFGCAHSVTGPSEPDVPRFEFKQWGTIPTRNASTSHEPWKGLSGLKQAYFIRNVDDVDLKFEFILKIYGAVLNDNRSVIIPIEDAELLSETPGLISREITPNYDPVDIVENFVIEAGLSGYGISFALIDWNNPWFAVWTTVEITAITNLSKTTNNNEVKLSWITLRNKAKTMFWIQGNF